MRVRFASGETQTSLEFGNLDSAHRHPMWYRAIEFDDGAVAFLAHEADMRDCNDMTAVHPQEKGRIELSLDADERSRLGFSPPS